MLPARTTRTLAAITLAGAASLAVAACGGANKPPTRTTGHVGGGPTVAFATASREAYKHSACMRSHGVPNFPDPQTSSSNGQFQIAIHLTPGITGSPAFQSAQRKCAYLMPGGGQNVTNGPSAAQVQAHTEALLAFARCLRSHGFARFPDPNSQGELSLTAVQNAGINLATPAFKPAALSCAGVTHGILTKADVERAIADPNASGHSQSAAPSP